MQQIVNFVVKISLGVFGVLMTALSLSAWNTIAGVKFIDLAAVSNTKNAEQRRVKHQFKKTKPCRKVVSKHRKTKRPSNARVAAPSTQSNQDSSEMKKAGEFKGDLRNLPGTKPVPRERPRPEDPPVVRRAVPTPTPK